MNLQQIAKGSATDGLFKHDRDSRWVHAEYHSDGIRQWYGDIPLTGNEKSFDLHSHTKLRYVHAARKRTLRKRGIPIHFAGYSPYGRPLYVWAMLRVSVMERT